mmetsp:Transcript_121594/g.242231  ORF Transcript_121594/g.242231 Transcript_121594/m.242231 type:complete len:215 (+) Transcript_121594:185-829(+)
MRCRSRSTPIILTASWSPTDGLSFCGPSSRMGQKPRTFASSPTIIDLLVLRTKPTKAPYGLISSTTPRTVLPTGTKSMRASSQLRPLGPSSSLSVEYQFFFADGPRADLAYLRPEKVICGTGGAWPGTSCLPGSYLFSFCCANPGNDGNGACAPGNGGSCNFWTPTCPGNGGNGGKGCSACPGNGGNGGKDCSTCPSGGSGGNGGIGGTSPASR